VDEFCFRDRESEPLGGCDSGQRVEVALEELVVAFVRRGADRYHNVVYVRYDDAFRYCRMEGGNVDHEEKGRDGGALQDSN